MLRECNLWLDFWSIVFVLYCIQNCLSYIDEGKSMMVEMLVVLEGVFRWKLFRSTAGIVRNKIHCTCWQWHYRGWKAGILLTISGEVLWWMNITLCISEIACLIDWQDIIAMTWHDNKVMYRIQHIRQLDWARRGHNLPGVQIFPDFGFVHGYPQFLLADYDFALDCDSSSVCLC